VNDFKNARRKPEINIDNVLFNFHCNIIYANVPQYLRCQPPKSVFSLSYRM